MKNVIKIYNGRAKLRIANCHCIKNSSKKEIIPSIITIKIKSVQQYFSVTISFKFKAINNVHSPRIRVCLVK